jgi:hypothetical protein
LQGSVLRNIANVKFDIFMIKKITVVLLFLLALQPNSIFAQGKAKGFYAAYNLSMLPNRDDLDADQRLDYVTTFRFGAGFEKINFKSNNFGIGYQLGVCQTGQDYTGLDTFTKLRISASTNLTYAKLSLNLLYRSYDRYNPEKRFKVTTSLGPYIALMGSFKDEVKVYDAANTLVGDYYFEPSGLRNTKATNTNIDLKEPIYNLLDIGFSVAPGIQYMITPKLAVVFQVRADVSATNVENTGNIKKKLANPPANPADENYDKWGNLYAKYIDYSPLKKDPYNVRPATKNLNVGAQLTIRIYDFPQFSK